MPDDHSKLVPLLPIPNRTVKRLSADDSADSRVKVGHRQALSAQSAPPFGGAFCIDLAMHRNDVVQIILGHGQQEIQNLFFHGLTQGGYHILKR